MVRTAGGHLYSTLCSSPQETDKMNYSPNAPSLHFSPPCIFFFSLLPAASDFYIFYEMNNVATIVNVCILNWSQMHCGTQYHQYYMKQAKRVCLN